MLKTVSSRLLYRYSRTTSLTTPSVTALGHPRTNPKHYAYIFIPSDIISLTLQGEGGGLSSGTAHQTGVDLSLAGLVLQVFSLTVFSLLALDWIRHWRSSKDNIALPRKFKVFAWILVVAVLLILARCVYRIDELSQGYDGSLFHDQASFIVLEGVQVVPFIYSSTSFCWSKGLMFLE